LFSRGLARIAGGKSELEYSRARGWLRQRVSLTARAASVVCRFRERERERDRGRKASAVRVSRAAFYYLRGIARLHISFQLIFRYVRKMPLRRRFLLYAPSNSITLQKVVPESFEFVLEHRGGEGVAPVPRRKHAGAVLYPRYALRELFRALSTFSLVIIPLKYLLSPSSPVDFNEARRASGDEIEMHLAPCFGGGALQPSKSTRSSQVRASSEITEGSHAASGELDPARWRPFHEDHQRLPQLFQPRLHPTILCRAASSAKAHQK